MTIQELREARNKAWQGAKAFVESKRDKDGLLSKEDAEAYAKMEQKIKDYSAEIERMEQMESIETYLKAGKEQERQEKPPIADDVLAGELKTALEKILKLRLGESLDKIESLESYSLRKEVRERLTEIKVQLKLYEDSRAEELLQELLDDLAEEEL